MGDECEVRVDEERDARVTGVALGGGVVVSLDALAGTSFERHMSVMQNRCCKCGGCSAVL